ncbi:MAG TPA: DUF1353 domain-containing protein [Kiritimatiellia bacterium]|nr:DUF1353 domain-containing protein [Kiritimatiellia bacterium]
MTSSCAFIGRLVTTSAGKRFRWRLTESFGFIHSSGRIDVPEGFETDFASVPRIFWSILPLTDAQYDQAAVIHDFAVRNRRRLGLRLVDCHRIFYEAMRCGGVPWFRASIMYRAVLCFNWLFVGEGRG